MMLIINGVILFSKILFICFDFFCAKIDLEDICRVKYIWELSL